VWVIYSPLDSLAVGHWMYYEPFWNAVKGLLKHIAWDFRRIQAEGYGFLGAGRSVVGMKSPAGKLTVMIVNRTANPMSHTGFVGTGMVLNGTRYKFDDSESVIGTSTGQILSTTVPACGVEFWKEL
jgi:hypothetical protein